MTEWAIQPEAAFPLRPAHEVPAAVGQVQFARAGPDMNPEVEGLLQAAAKQRKYQRSRQRISLPEHDVRALAITPKLP